MQHALLILLIGLTGLSSYLAFQDSRLQAKMEFNPVAIRLNREWYRFISYGLVHAGWMHLILNLYVLWMFGEAVLDRLFVLYGPPANLWFLGLYVPGLAISSLYSYFRHRHNEYYRAVGASGAVSAVVFSFIILYPSARMGLLFIPFMLPSWLFGALYLVYCIVMARRGNDNIGHDAHFWGAVFGIIFTFAAVPNAMSHFFYVIFHT